MEINSLVPVTTVHLLKDVPLDNTYKDTLTFANSSTQSTFFLGKTKSGATWSNMKPVRLNTNQMQLPICSDSILDCNYLMFKNQNFNNRWLYAFIINVEFISITACTVTFEIDVMQTWMFDYNINSSFVVREHVTSDNIGENLIPENLETGEYICNSINEFDFSEQSVAILSSIKLNADNTTSPPEGKTVNGVYSGLNVTAGYPASNADAINGSLQRYVQAGKEDAIIAVYQYPTFCGNATTTAPVAEERDITSNVLNLNTYEPKNKKLFTYPYNYIIMSNNEGKTATFRYENFQSPESIKFDVVGVYLTSPNIFCYPKYHRGIVKDYDSGININNFPQCAWVGDAFKAWFSQNKGALALSTLANVREVAGGVVTRNPIAVAQGTASIAGEIGAMYDHTQTPPQVHGQVNTDSLNSGMGRIKFSFYKMSVNARFAKIIDDYFTRFGYKVNSLKVPNINTRPHWNYVETIDVNLTGSIPFSDMSKIKSIYNSGVTFWHGDYVGDYSLNNAI